MGQTQGIFDDIKDWFRQQRFGFSVQGLPDDKFMVVEMQGSETMARPYSFRLSLVSSDSRINFDSVMEKSATLTVQRERRKDPDFKYYGIVTSFEQGRKVGRYTYYAATIEPRLTLLSRYRYSEVYVNQSVKQVVVKVLTECGLFEGTDFEVRLKEYPTIDFICQYEESCLDFISRLMEREGIYYYFDNGEGRERLILVDALIGHSPGSGDLIYRQAGEMETEPGIDSMQSLVCHQRTLPKTLKLRNYYYDSAQPQVYAEATISPKGIGSIELFGEDIRNAGDATNLAKVRAEEISCREKHFEGESSSVGIRPGLFFTLSRHYREDFCQKYLPISVVHEGSQNIPGLTGLDRELQGLDRKASYQNKITAITADVQFRSERVTSKPMVVGSMSGFIDGPSGEREYADLDDKGRYKIWFPFRRHEPRQDQLQHQSGYVRFATPNAGPESGMHFPLRKDSEVILSFNGGNPDLPIITGAAANAKFPNMVTSKNYTRNVWKTRGENLLEMADNDEHQLIRLMTPRKNTVISMGETTRVLENLAGLNSAQQDSRSGGNGSSGSGSSGNGPVPENLQLYTEGNTLTKGGGYMRVESGATSTVDHDPTKSPQVGDLMKAVKNDAISWVGRNEWHRVNGHILNQVGANPPGLPPTGAGGYTVCIQGDEQHKAGGYSLTEVGAAPSERLSDMIPGRYHVGAQQDISFVTPQHFRVKCYESNISTNSHWVKAGTSWALTEGDTKSVFAGHAFTSNIGSLERVFIGDRMSLFTPAVKLDMHTLKTEINMVESKGVITKWESLNACLETVAAKTKSAITEINNTGANIVSGATLVATLGMSLLC